MVFERATDRWPGSGLIRPSVEPLCPGIAFELLQKNQNLATAAAEPLHAIRDPFVRLEFLIDRCHSSQVAEREDQT